MSVYLPGAGIVAEKSFSCLNYHPASPAPLAASSDETSVGLSRLDPAGLRAEESRPGMNPVRLASAPGAGLFQRDYARQCRNPSRFPGGFRMMHCGILGMTVLLWVCALAAFAKAQITVETLLEFVNSSISTKVQDKDVAAYLATVRLIEKLDQRTVEELRSQGAGPKTITALNKLASASAGLQTPAARVAALKREERAAPPYEEQQDIIRQVRDYALNYSMTLPDFICLQVTRRYVDPHYKPGTEGSWLPKDRLVQKLTFFDQKENYEAIGHDDTSLYGKQAEDVGSASSRGEFGTLLREIFDPSSNAEFQWDRWGDLDNEHWFHVYTYAIDRAHSHEIISHNNTERVRAPYHGEIFVQEGRNIIWRVSAEPELPPRFPMQGIQQVVDYRFVYLGGQPFLLPVHGWMTVRADGAGHKNELDFRDYRKYSTRTSITFDDAGTDPDPSKD